MQSVIVMDRYILIGLYISHLSLRLFLFLMPADSNRKKSYDVTDLIKLLKKESQYCLHFHPAHVHSCHWVGTFPESVFTLQKVCT